jgi:parallel beta-helix repeat protein
LVISRESHHEIGYLALQGCSNITVRNLWLDGGSISGPSTGIILKNTTNSTLIHNHLTHLWAGIYLHNSYGNLVADNYLADGTHGIVITAEQANTITNSTIQNNEVGVSLLGSAQVIYRNNLINNTQQVHSTDWHEYNYKPVPNGVHVWDSGGQGNYWSDYAATDSNHDGIADKPHTISQVRINIDHYPLIAPVEIPGFIEPSPPPTQTPNNLPSALSDWILPVVVVAVIGVCTVLILYVIKHKGNRVNL